jgi:hypothetical protein
LSPKMPKIFGGVVKSMRHECNICESTEFVDFKDRPKAMCFSCRSVERTRVLKVIFDKVFKIKPKMRVMHFAPELGIGRYLRSIVGDGYEAYDIDPPRYPAELNVKPFDLVEDTEKLESNTYDLILHSHVMEHIPCNVTAVLYHLHRAVKRSGRHIFSVPFFHGASEEDLGSISPQEKERRFGQDDHVRKFGRGDIDRNLGKIFHLPAHDLLKVESAENLEKFSIPKMAWQGHTSHSFFVLKKGDLKLR